MFNYVVREGGGENDINLITRGKNLIAWEAGNSELTLILPFHIFKLQLASQPLPFW